NLYYCLKLHLPVKVFSCLHFCTCMTLHTDQQSAKRSSQETNLSLTVERANWHIQPKSFMIMKQTEVETDTVIGKPKQATPPPPPPPPPLPRFWARKTTADSVTNQEIARFWRQKRVEEEDHLLAAIKAAARIRARNLPEEDYKRFEESLNDEDNNPKEKITAPTNNSEGDEKNNEIRVGIKDWWTKSKYAY
ncbi:Translocon at inner membrane of chloroplasts 21, putative isoform 2, partial [Theobroma cacao]